MGQLFFSFVWQLTLLSLTLLLNGSLNFIRYDTLLLTFPHNTPFGLHPYWFIVLFRVAWVCTQYLYVRTSRYPRFLMFCFASQHSLVHIHMNLHIIVGRMFINLLIRSHVRGEMLQFAISKVDCDSTKFQQQLNFLVQFLLVFFLPVTTSFVDFRFKFWSRFQRCPWYADSFIQVFVRPSNTHVHD